MDAFVGGGVFGVLLLSLFCLAGLPLFFLAVHSLRRGQRKRAVGLSVAASAVGLLIVVTSITDHRDMRRTFDESMKQKQLTAVGPMRDQVEQMRTETYENNDRRLYIRLAVGGVLVVAGLTVLVAGKRASQDKQGAARATIQGP